MAISGTETAAFRNYPQWGDPKWQGWSDKEGPFDAIDDIFYLYENRHLGVVFPSGIKDVHGKVQ